MRLFVAIALPQDLRDRLEGLRDGLPGAKWVAAENLHLTLRFIGEADGGECHDIDAALAGLRFESFPLQIEGLGHFGEGRRLRALWAGVAPNPDLERLQGKIERALQSAGMEPSKRKYKPHVTLARFKSGPGPRLHSFIAAHGLFRAAPFEVTEFTLFSSYLAQQGAIYTPELSYPLEPRKAPLDARLE